MSTKNNKASLINPTGKSPFGPRETQRILKRRAKWVENLTNGKFKQGTGALEIPFDDTTGEYSAKHCCLGVAREVCKVGTDGYSELSGYGLEKLGMTDAQQQHLVNLNDSLGKNFKQIAKVIEKLPLDRE